MKSMSSGVETEKRERKGKWRKMDSCLYVRTYNPKHPETIQKSNTHAPYFHKPGHIPWFLEIKKHQVPSPWSKSKHGSETASLN
jgi:hypothetical protein